MENNRIDSSMGKKDPRKWSLSSFFRTKKKKISDSESSSEDDRRKVVIGSGGFQPQQKRKKEKRKRVSKLEAFDHVVLTPNAQKNIDAINNSDRYMLSNGGTGSLDRRLRRERRQSLHENNTSIINNNNNRSSSSSEDEPAIMHYRSDESVGSCSNYKSRTSRTERYMRRMADPMRWHTQPVNFTVHVPAATPPSASLPPQHHQQYHYHQHNTNPHHNVPGTRIDANRLRNSKSLQQINNFKNLQLASNYGPTVAPIPPPIPPKGTTRPLSYTFADDPRRRYASDDRLTRSTSTQPEIRRFIRRHEPEFTYVANLSPRSRQPLHVLEPAYGPPKPARTFTTIMPNGPPRSVSMEQCLHKPNMLASVNNKEKADEYKYTFDENLPYFMLHNNNNTTMPQLNSSGDTTTTIPQNIIQPSRNHHRSRNVNRDSCKQRSLSSSRVLEMVSNERLYPVPKAASNETNQNSNNNVVNGRLCLRKSNLPNPSYNLQIDHTQKLSPPVPKRSSSRHTSWHEEKIFNNNNNKTRNLEDAITELENIYKSLKLDDDDDDEFIERLLPQDNHGRPGIVMNGTTTRMHEQEPDIVRDDVLNRSLRHANNAVKVTMQQPPFGIPIGPIPPGIGSMNYIECEKNIQNIKPSCPINIVVDDLAFRSLRKDRDQPKAEKPKFPICRKISNPGDLCAIVQKASAKPSGEVDESEDLKQIAAKIELKPAARAIASKQYNEGAIFNLPSTLQRHPSPPTSLQNLRALKPNKTPPTLEVETLNQIADHARATSEKLGHDLLQLRLSVSPNVQKSPNKGLREEVTEVSKAVKMCEEMIKNAAKDNVKIKCTKEDKDKLMHEMREAAKAAKTCEEMIGGVLAEKSPSPEQIKARLQLSKESVRIETQVEPSQKPNVQELTKIYEGRRSSSVEQQTPKLPRKSETPKLPPSAAIMRKSSETPPKKEIQIPKPLKRMSIEIDESNKKDEIVLKTPVKLMAAKIEGNMKHKSAFVRVTSPGQHEPAKPEVVVQPQTTESKVEEETPSGSPQYENLRETPEKTKPIKVNITSSSPCYKTQHSREDEIEQILKECEEYSSSTQRLTVTTKNGSCSSSSSLNLSDYKTSASSTPQILAPNSTVPSSSPKYTVATVVDDPSLHPRNHLEQQLPQPQQPPTNDDDSQYNSSEELATIFGIDRSASSNKANTPGKTVRACLTTTNTTNLTKKHDTLKNVLTPKTNSTAVNVDEQAKSAIATNTQVPECFLLDTILESHDEQFLSNVLVVGNDNDDKHHGDDDEGFTSRDGSLDGINNVDEPPLFEIDIPKTFPPDIIRSIHTPTLPYTTKGMIHEKPNMNKHTHDSDSQNHQHQGIDTTDAAVPVPAVETTVSRKVMVPAPRMMSASKNANAYDKSSSRTTTTTTSTSTDCSSNNNNRSSKTINHSQSIIQPEHLILACTPYYMENVDHISLLAIVIAIITLFAILSM